MIVFSTSVSKPDSNVRLQEQFYVHYAAALGNSHKADDRRAMMEAKT